VTKLENQFIYRD